jgi:hypothetical protein
MSIRFAHDALPVLYQFKRATIALCVQYVRDVLNASHRRRIHGLQQRINEIETDLYDLFCRWNFVALAHQRYLTDRCLPTDSQFIVLKDLYYYLQRFGVDAQESLVPFPLERFETILRVAHEGSQTHPPPRAMYPSDAQTRRMKSVYRGTEYSADVTKLLARYQYLGGLNNSLSVPPAVLDTFRSHELFGTPLNTHTSFCSPFADEAVFSSSGSFFQFSAFDADTVYFANPPFDEKFCDDVADRLLEQLAQRVFQLVVIIPVWDTEVQKARGLKDFHLPFMCYRKLVQSPYFLSEHFLDKDAYPFYNYFSQRMVFICNVHLINLGVRVDTEALMKAWKKID